MDLTAQVVEAINAWLQSVSAQLLAPALSAVGQLLFATPAFDQIPEVEALWSLVRNTADALFLLAVLVAGILVMASGTVESRYSAKLLVSRLVLAALVANTSLGIAGGLIRVDNALVAALFARGHEGTGAAQLSALLLPLAASPVASAAIALTAAAFALLVVATGIGRNLLLLLATVLAPLALATYALPQTEEIARLWWRIYSALLFGQLVQALLVSLGLELIHHTNWISEPVSALTSGLVLVTLLYVLFRLPFALYHLAVHLSVAPPAAMRTVVVAARRVARVG